MTAARTVLTQFGFAHGWRMAEAMRAEFLWDSDDEWRSAGTRIHALEGQFRVEPEIEKEYIVAALALNEGNQTAPPSSSTSGLRPCIAS